MSSLHLSHSDRLSMSFDRLFSIESVSLPATYNTVSSAYIRMLEYSMTSIASLKEMRNNRGPSIEPCGTLVY